VGDTDCVSTRNTPRYGEQVVSWHTVWDRLYPEETDALHDDDEAAAMHRLRGLVMAQGAEIEAVLGLIVQHLDPSADVERRSAGQLLKKIPGLLQAHASATSQADLDLIKQAIERRNHAVHSAVMIGSSWMPYSTGRGEWTPVISLMRDGEYTEPDLLDDLALQQEATAAAVGILRSLDEPDN
jgi:hypothetical protein